MQKDNIKSLNECDCDEDNNCGCSYPNNVDKFAYQSDEKDSSAQNKINKESICICDTNADCSCKQI